MRSNIKAIINELHQYMGKDKRKVFEVRINERLNKSLKQYYDDLNKTLEKLYLYNDKYEDNRLIKKL